MLNWICPDCGRECAPTNRECPACAEESRRGPQSAAPVSEGRQTALTTIEGPPGVLLLTPSETTYAKNGNGANGNGKVASEPPQPTAASLQALVENLEQQIEPNLARTPWSPGAPPVADPPVAPLALLQPPPAPVAPPPAEFVRAQQVRAEGFDSQTEDAARQSAISKIAGSFQLAPQTLLLDVAKDVAEPPAPMQTSCIALARPVITMRPPAGAGPTLAASPQPPLLAGPILPAELQSLSERRAPRSVRPPNKAKVPTWLISVTVITIMILGMTSVMQRGSSERGANTTTTPPAAVVTVTDPPAAPVDQHPLARFVEVTGLRVVVDLQHRSQLQYIVVNHSASEMSGLALQITVRSLSAPDGKTPLFHVSTLVPTLGPYQSKEMRTDVNAQLQSEPIPDWDNLKADVLATAAR